jgi:hypothetical protein
MRTIGKLFANVFDSATSERGKIQREWDKARREAASFGPSHVSEVDAIFQRQI